MTDSIDLDKLPCGSTRHDFLKSVDFDKFNVKQAEKTRVRGALTNVSQRRAGRKWKVSAGGESTTVSDAAKSVLSSLIGKFDRHFAELNSQQAQRLATGIEAMVAELNAVLMLARKCERTRIELDLD